MIESPEYATPTQLELHRRWQMVHCKFFPSPPPITQRQKPGPPPVIAAQPQQPPPKLQPVKIIPYEATNLRIKLIRRAVCRFYGITEEALKSTRRTHDIVVPRHMFSYLASQLTNASTPMMGRALGGQDHTTVLHAILGMRQRVQSDRALREQAEQLKQALRQQFGDTAMPSNCIGRYVRHERVEEYFKVGWMWAANLNEYAALMVWVCACPCVEPGDG